MHELSFDRLLTSRPTRLLATPKRGEAGSILAFQIVRDWKARPLLRSRYGGDDVGLIQVSGLRFQL
jgi:hypothetical protein